LTSDRTSIQKHPETCSNHTDTGLLQVTNFMQAVD